MFRHASVLLSMGRALCIFLSLRPSFAGQLTRKRAILAQSAYGTGEKFRMLPFVNGLCYMRRGARACLVGPAARAPAGAPSVRILGLAASPTQPPSGCNEQA
jgi:hypothetical protein